MIWLSRLVTHEGVLSNYYFDNWYKGWLNNNLHISTLVLGMEVTFPVVYIHLISSDISVIYTEN